MKRKIPKTAVSLKNGFVFKYFNPSLFKVGQKDSGFSRTRNAITDTAKRQKTSESTEIVSAR